MNPLVGFLSKKYTHSALLKRDDADENIDDDVQRESENNVSKPSALSPSISDDIPHDIRIKMFEIDYEMYKERVQRQKDELSALFGLLESITLLESQERIKSHPDYQKAFKQRNGCDLIRS